MQRDCAVSQKPVDVAGLFETNIQAVSCAAFLDESTSEAVETLCVCVCVATDRERADSVDGKYRAEGATRETSSNKARCRQVDSTQGSAVGP
jgi:hypothetical protein